MGYMKKQNLELSMLKYTALLRDDDSFQYECALVSQMKSPWFLCLRRHYFGNSLAASNKHYFTLLSSHCVYHLCTHQRVNPLSLVILPNARSDLENSQTENAGRNLESYRNLELQEGFNSQMMLGGIC
jgi:hypothetical protein